MIKIIDITNCRIFNGLTIITSEFHKIVEVLTYSNFAHTITYFDFKENKEKVMVV